MNANLFSRLEYSDDSDSSLLLQFRNFVLFKLKLSPAFRCVASSGNFDLGHVWMK